MKIQIRMVIMIIFIAKEKMKQKLFLIKKNFKNKKSIFKYFFNIFSSLPFAYDTIRYEKILAPLDKSSLVFFCCCFFILLFLCDFIHILSTIYFL